MRKLLIILMIMASNTALAENKILIYGGADHDVYLGCLNCSALSSESVHNGLSPYGNPLNSESIFNTMGEYGSPLSSYSACNELASTPPMVLDSEGNIVGFLTLNVMRHGAITDENVVAWLKYKVCGK